MVLFFFGIVPMLNIIMRIEGCNNEYICNATDSKNSRDLTLKTEMSETDITAWQCQPGFQEKFVASNVDVCFGGGVLNPQPLDSLVHTPRGFMRMGDLRVGDTISDVNGGTQKINAIIKKGLQTCVELTLDDGRTVRSALSHTWRVKDDCGMICNISTASIIRGVSSKKYEFFVLDVKDVFIGDGVSEKYVALSDYRILPPCQMQCISVSGADHLYVTDGYIATHNCGKTFASVLSTAEPSLDPEFRAVFIRKTFTEITSGGGMYDEFKTIFGKQATYKSSQPPRVTFSSGAYVDFRQVNNEDIKKIKEEWKGAQYTLIYLDEATSIQFSTFKYLLTRNRSKSRFHPTIKATMNPERECWIRTFIDWYVGSDGKIIPERDGVVRYFYIYGDRPDEVFWGDTKEEVYKKGKIEIDRKLRALGGDFTYENMIKSFVFYLGKMSENKASIGNNMDYAGSVASVGGHQAEQLIEGNWNASSRDRSSYLIKPSDAAAVTSIEPQTNGVKYICVDLADTGTNSTVIGVFDGFHWIDAQILNTSTPKQNAEWIKRMARKYDIADNHIIYDAQRAAYMIDHIPDAVGYYSFSPARGIYKREYKRRKDENFARFIDAVNRGGFSISPEVAKMLFERTKTGEVTFLQKFIDECGVVQWSEDNMSGKKRLLSKKEMTTQLGRGESTDILDTAQMLMSAYEQCEYGLELDMARREDQEESEVGTFDIYEDSNWA